MSVEERMAALDTSCCPRDVGFVLEFNLITGCCTCVEVGPVLWIPQHILDQMPYEHVEFDGEHVKLTVDNGIWIWRLTGRTHVHSYGPETTPCVLREGKWPD